MCLGGEAIHGGRCGPCNALNGRARTAGKAMGSWDAFMKVSKEKKTEFFRNCHDEVGKELKALMEETISESIAEEELESWIADGKYLDYADMEDKYKNKPDQLKSIFANTKTHFCTVRNCKLYEDPEYMSRRSSTLVTKTESKRQASAEKISKAAKVPKVVVQDDDAEISACQVKLLGKEKDQLRLMHTMLSALKAEADLERLKAAIAPPILTKLKLAIGNLDGQEKLIELTLENKKGDVASIVSENKAAKTEAIATAKLMRAQLVVAKSLAPPLDAD